MPWANYVATSDSLIALHVAGVTYSVTFRLTKADRMNEILKTEQRSLAGDKETLYFGRVRTWSITLEPIPAAETPLIEEFLASTANGQVFTFDPYGIETNPGLPMLVDREDKGHSTRRVISTGDAMFSDYFEYSFSLNQRT